MSKVILKAETRTDLGKGASRRLRRAGKIPAILYGGDQPPRPIQLDVPPVLKALEFEETYSSILPLEIDGQREQVILRDLQRHPAKPVVLHMDFQRVVAGEKLRVHVPLHFIGEDEAVGVKAGGTLTHHLMDVEVECLPKDLPEYIEVDVRQCQVGDTIHLSDLQLPAGVVLVAFLGAEEMSEEERHAIDQAVCSIQPPGGGAAAAEEAEEAGGEEA